MADRWRAMPSRVRRRAFVALSRQHGRRGADGLASLARGYLNAYENRGTFDPATDGEQRVVEVLAGFGPTVVFDVGANVGDWTRLVVRAVPGAAVHAFEVVPETADLLARAVGGLPQVTVHRLGLADAPGELEVAVPAAGSAKSSAVEVRGATSSAVEATIRRCPVDTGAAVAERLGVAHIDLLKVDTEGADHLVLAGCTPLLTRGAVDVVQFEYGPWALRTRFLLRDFWDLLEGHGYLVGKVYPRGVDFRPFAPELEDFRGLNYVAVRAARPDLRDALALR